jgi:crossover junction endodeoxyribonuclease RuvC
MVWWSSSGSRLVHLDNGAIFTDKATGFPDRLRLIFEGLSRVMQRVFT